MTDPTLPVPSADAPAPVPTPASAPAPASTQALASARPPKRPLRWITPTLAIIAALAVGVVGGVFIGRSGAAHAGPGTFARGQLAGGQAGAGGFAGGGFTAGTIESIDGTTITIKAQNGTKTKVSTSNSTRVSKTSRSSVSALKKGQAITVIGAAGADGTIAATAISEGAGLRGGFGGRQDVTATPPASGN